MNVIRQHCYTCNGTGVKINWITTAAADNPATGIAHKRVDTCQQCKGKGYTESVLFSIEEAKVILSHCGLSTESLG